MMRNFTGIVSSVMSSRNGHTEPPIREICLVCDQSMAFSDLYATLRVCPICRFHYSLTARERIESLADPESFREINRSISSLDPLSFSSRGSYKQRIFRDQRRTGLTEAVVTGRCSISGSPAMLIALDFGFMGGTMGCVVGEKVALALEQAAKRNLPAIAVITSGGARFQEGVLSLMQMAKTSIAAVQLAQKGLPFIVVLANPTTGQTYASFASLADIIVSEPEAIVGFSSVRDLQEAEADPLPSGSQTAEAHLQNGLIDGIVDRTKLRSLLAIILDLLGQQYRLTSSDKGRKRTLEPQKTDAWDYVQLARHEDRPTSSDYIASMLDNFVEIHGDRRGEEDETVICGLGQIGGLTVMAVGQERSRASVRGVSPAGFRKAQRAFEMAGKFGLPVITLIDSVGPDVSLEAEERGLGRSIAKTIADLSGINSPTIAVVIGEGGSEAALAFGVADRVLMMENAIYSTISPEEAAELIYQDEARAEEVAASLKLTAHDCRAYGIVDLLVQEPPGGAHTDHDEAARQLRRVLLQELADLLSKSNRSLLRDRYKKFRNMGEYSSYFRAAINREASALQGLVSSGVRRIARRQTSEQSEPPQSAAMFD